MDKQQNAAAMRERYYWLKEHGICVRCGQEPSYKGLTSCIYCRAINNADMSERRRERTLTPEKLESIRMANKKLKDTRRQAGLCPKCGKPAQAGKVHCGRCLAKDRQRAAEKRVQQGKIPRDVGMGLGLCSYCLKNPVMQDKKVCAACYPRALQLAANARMYINYSDHIFRRMSDDVFRRYDMRGDTNA